jgi:ribosomal protein L37AE/L43A
MEVLELATRAPDVDCPVCGRNEVIKEGKALVCNLCGASSANPDAGFPTQRTSSPKTAARRPARKPAAKKTPAKRSAPKRASSSAKAPAKPSSTATTTKGGTA